MPWGEAKFNSYKPSYGPRAIPPAQGNDSQGNCDPLGIPRLLMFENNPALNNENMPSPAMT